MRGVHPVAEVRSAEEATLARVPAPELMLRAATVLQSCCAQVLHGRRGRVYGAHVVLLVGTGNNGGDALFAGAGLARRGARVVAVPTSTRTHEAGTAALLGAGGVVVPADEAADTIAAADLVVDGILGIGGEGNLREPARSLVEQVMESGAVVVAADLPSGVDADTGQAGDEAVWADVTVTFGLLKPGLLLHPGAMHCGIVRLADIGLTRDAVVPAITCLDNDDVVDLLPRPTPVDHKYSSGVVGIAAGSPRFPGAAVLAVGGALGTKPGMVQFVGPTSDDVVRAWPSVIGSRGSVHDVSRVRAWGVGPGIGTDDQARRIVQDVVAGDLPVVADADALTLLARSPEHLRRRAAPTVLTPHAGEFARLAPDLDVDRDPVAAVRTLAARLRCTVLLKGATTIVADPDGQVRLNLTGTPWLATAGTGDVLTGIVAALLASGLGPLDAASVGAYLHGLAGRLASDGGPVTSADVVRAVPQAVASVLTA